MTSQHAIDFLSQNQPLPMEMSPELQASFNDAIGQLLEDPASPEMVVPLLLNCWNYWMDGFNNEAIIYVLKKYPVELIGPYVAFGLEDKESSRRMWFGEVARAFPHPQCTAGLLKMLHAEEALERFIGACALEYLDDANIRDCARKRLQLEADPETIQVLEAIVEKG